MTATFAEVATLDGPSLAEADLHARAWKARRRRPARRGPAAVLATTSLRIDPRVMAEARRRAAGDPARLLLCQDGGVLVVNRSDLRQAWRDYARRS